MGLIIPQLEDLTYNDILTQAMVRIPVHNPEWTNFNDSDPGITLLQLFAFMYDSLLYRANLIPERNRLKFLTLLGMTLTPASAAQGVITIANERGPLETVTLPSNLTMTAGQVGFVTQNGLDVLPIEMQVFYRQPLSDAQQQSAQQTYGVLYSTFTDDATQLEFYETMPLPEPTSAASIPSVSLTDGTDTVDGALWLALLTRTGETAQASDVLQAISNRVLMLSLMPQVDDATRILYPGGSASGQAQLEYAISTGATGSNAQLYQTLESNEDDNPLQNLTLVQLTLPSSNVGVWSQLAPLEDGTGDYPPTLNDPTLTARLLAWIRIRLAPNPDGSIPANVTANFSWAGINAARVTQQIQVVAEPLGAGTGEPDQSVQLANTPVITTSVQLAVNTALWSQIDDLMAAAPEVPVRDPSLPPGTPMPAPGNPQVYTVDGESGTIQFGDGLHGARPADGTPIVASYAYGGGSSGNIGIGAIQSSPQLPAGFTIQNPLPTWGGDDGETVEQAEQNIPSYLQNGGRAVSADDFVSIVRQTPGVALAPGQGRVEVLPLFNPDQPDIQVPGAVTVMVIPEGSGAPEPDLTFLDAVCNFLDPKRLVTTEVYVRGPEYVPFYCSLGIDVVAGQNIATVRQAVQVAIRNYLSPLTGGPSGSGWPLSKPVDQTGLMVQALLVSGVSDVAQILLWDGNMNSITQLPISGLQLPALQQVSVSSGDAQDLSTAGTTSTTTVRVVIPIPQPSC
jgi:hypothetical protein